MHIIVLITMFGYLGLEAAQVSTDKPTKSEEPLRCYAYNTTMDPVTLFTSRGQDATVIPSKTAIELTPDFVHHSKRHMHVVKGENYSDPKRRTYKNINFFRGIPSERQRYIIIEKNSKSESGLQVRTVSKKEYDEILKKDYQEKHKALQEAVTLNKDLLGIVEEYMYGESEAKELHKPLEQSKQLEQAKRKWWQFWKKKTADKDL